MTTGESAGNLGKTALSGTYCQPGCSTYNIRCAIAFTTGNKSAGYTLESVTADFDAPNGSPGNIIVAIHEPESGGGSNSVNAESASNPKDAALVTLTGSNPTSAGQQKYTCEGSDCDLDAGTTYFLVITTADVSGGDKWYRLKTTSDTGETKVPSTNTWAIANTGRVKYGTTAWQNFSSNATGIIGIIADNRVIQFSTARVSATAATLNIANHTAAWWYKRTAPAGDSTCHKANAGTSSISLSGLTPGSSYTYNAYRYEFCLAAYRMTWHSFTTPILYISNAAPTAVTLNIANHSSNWRYKANTGRTPTAPATKREATSTSGD